MPTDQAELADVRQANARNAGGYTERLQSYHTTREDDREDDGG